MMLNQLLWVMWKVVFDGSFVGLGVTSLSDVLGLTRELNFGVIG